MSLGVNGGERQWRRGNGDVGLTASGWGKGFYYRIQNTTHKEDSFLHPISLGYCQSNFGDYLMN